MVCEIGKKKIRRLRKGLREDEKMPERRFKNGVRARAEGRGQGSEEEEKGLRSGPGRQR